MTELAGQTGIQVALDFAYPGEFFPAEFFPAEFFPGQPRAVLSRERSLGGTVAATGTVTDATADRERSLGGFLTVELAPTGELAVQTPRPLRVHIVVMPDRKPITLTMPAVPATPVPTDRPMVTVTMPPSREVTVAIPDRQPIVLKMARGRGTPPPSWRPSFAVRDAAGSYR